MTQVDKRLCFSEDRRESLRKWALEMAFHYSENGPSSYDPTALTAIAERFEAYVETGK